MSDEVSSLPWAAAPAVGNAIGLYARWTPALIPVVGIVDTVDRMACTRQRSGGDMAYRAVWREGRRRQARGRMHADPRQVASGVDPSDGARQAT